MISLLPTHPCPGLHLLRGEGNDISGFTYLLQRQAGNFIVYNGGTWSEIGARVEELGGVTGVFLNDRHNAKQTDVISEICAHLNAPLYASVIEAKVPAIKNCPALSALPYEPSALGTDFEIIPLPGHTPGNLAYIWDAPDNRILFIGDTLVHQNGEWNFWVSKPNCLKMAQGLSALMSKEFDVIVSTSFGCTGGNVFSLTPESKGALFGGVIKRLEGKTRS